MLVGNGANGKSVLLSVLEELVGSHNVSGVQPSQLDRTFQRSHLHLKLANIVTEVKEGEIMAITRLRPFAPVRPARLSASYSTRSI